VIDAVGVVGYSLDDQLRIAAEIGVGGGIGLDIGVGDRGKRLAGGGDEALGAADVGGRALRPCVSVLIHGDVRHRFSCVNRGGCGWQVVIATGCVDEKGGRG